MQFNILTIVSFASLAVAAVTTTASSATPTGCAAQNIVDACTSQLQARVTACPANDWDCLCSTYTDLLTCYNNCPGSQEAVPVQNQVTQYCAAASQYGSKTTASKTPTGSSSDTVAVQTTSSSSNAQETTSTSSSTSPTRTPNSAASLEAAGSLLAVVFAGFGLLA